MTECIKVKQDGTVIKSRSIPQFKFSAECWSIQMWGKGECEHCEFIDTDECGGVNIRLTGKNEKGHLVPL
jgi:hypothetical protein